jgi:hypothetical protein
LCKHFSTPKFHPYSYPSGGNALIDERINSTRPFVERLKIDGDNFFEVIRVGALPYQVII